MANATRLEKLKAFADKHGQGVLSPGEEKIKGEESVKQKKLNNDQYLEILQGLQEELVRLQAWVKAKGLKVVILFEGRDAAGKGGVIKRIMERLNPRVAKVVALAAPTDREKKSWYFQRYIAHLPCEGKTETRKSNLP